MAISRRIVVIVALLCQGLGLAAPVVAQQAQDTPLPKLRHWTLADRDAVNAQQRRSAYRLRLDMAVVRGTAWAPEIILDAAGRAAAILAHCDIELGPVQLHEFDGPLRYRHFSNPDSREFARRAGLTKPTIFFVDDTLQRPAFDAEAIGRVNARSRPEMTDTVWITAATRDLPIVLAHELVHVLADSGDHSDAPDNLMREDTAPGNTHLTADQCARIVAVGRAHGLVVPAAARDGRR